jgi:hypothetical protein
MSETFDKDQYMTDSRGRLVPVELVPEIDRQRNDLVLEIIDKVLRLQDQMRNFKMSTMGDIQAFVDLSAERYDIKLGGHKGNTTLMSFDGRFKIQVAIAEHLSFDERLQVAKKLIDECLSDWAEDSRAELKTIVLDAFQVDQEGRINTGRILALRRYAIEDPRWQKAMQAIGDSIQVVGSKSYLRFYQRSGPEGRFSPIALDLAAL